MTARVPGVTSAGWITLGAAAVAAASGALALTGWQLSLPALKSLIPGRTAMNPATAVCFLLAGLALALLRRPGSNGAARLARAAALAVQAIAALKIAALAGLPDLGVDRWLFTGQLDDPSGYPNRMAPNTALNFLLVGTALATLEMRTRRGLCPHQLLVLPTTVLSLTAVLGYAFDATVFYGVPAYIPMALNTALTFLALSLGIFLARPDRGLARVVTSDAPGSAMARGLMPVVAVVALLAWLRLVGERAGLYTTEFGLTLTSLSSMVLITLVIWKTAASIDEKDAERREAQAALQRAHDDLDRRVRDRTAELEAANQSLQREMAERDAAERALQESQRRFTAFMDHSPVVAFIKDAEGRLVYVNRAFERAFATTRQEVEGRTEHELWPAEIADRYREHDRAALEAGTSVPVSETLPGPDGTPRHWWALRFPIADRGGAASIGGVAIDVTERHAAEEALRRTEDQLRQAQKMDAVGRLAGGVAHDFNNILTAILGFSQLMRAHLADDDPVRLDGEEIERAAMRAASLTRQLLAFSRQQVMQARVLDLNLVVREADKMLARLIGADIDLRTVPDDDLACVLADPGQIEQIVVNLVVNARDAMPGGGKLTIETANVELDGSYARDHVGVAPGRYVMLAVSDTGCGMDDETRTRIFEPFFTTKEVGKGTGLGLSTVYGIVRQSGGHIEVYSEAGRGTTFKIYLPAVDAAGAAAPAAAAPARAPHGSETILLVEDEDQVRAVMRQTLERHGYTVLEAHHGGEALEVCEQRRGEIDLLLTDIVMPQIGGPELVRRLERLEQELRVLYVSGYTDKAVVHHGVIAEGRAFLQKPFTPDALLRRVRDVLDEPVARAA